MRQMNEIQIPKNLENEARDWLLECFSDETCQETIRDLSAIELHSAINRYYCGGWNAFEEWPAFCRMTYNFNEYSNT